MDPIKVTRTTMKSVFLLQSFKTCFMPCFRATHRKAEGQTRRSARRCPNTRSEVTAGHRATCAQVKALWAEPGDLARGRPPSPPTREDRRPPPHEGICQQHFLGEEATKTDLDISTRDCLSGSSRQTRSPPRSTALGVRISRSPTAKETEGQWEPRHQPGGHRAGVWRAGREEPSRGAAWRRGTRWDGEREAGPPPRGPGSAAQPASASLGVRSASLP